MIVGYSLAATMHGPIKDATATGHGSNGDCDECVRKKSGAR
jgi:hypothetical protein